MLSLVFNLIFSYLSKFIFSINQIPYFLIEVSRSIKLIFRGEYFVGEGDLSRLLFRVAVVNYFCTASVGVYFYF